MDLRTSPGSLDKAMWSLSGQCGDAGLDMLQTATLKEASLRGSPHREEGGTERCPEKQSQGLDQTIPEASLPLDFSVM